jgi:hypothetical protein
VCLAAAKWDNRAFVENEVLSARRQAIRTDIARRLRKICAHFSDEEFERLVERMAEQKLRGERNGSL